MRRMQIGRLLLLIFFKRKKCYRTDINSKLCKIMKIKNMAGISLLVGDQIVQITPMTFSLFMYCCSVPCYTRDMYRNIYKFFLAHFFLAHLLLMVDVYILKLHFLHHVLANYFISRIKKVMG